MVGGRGAGKDAYKLHYAFSNNEKRFARYSSDWQMVKTTPIFGKVYISDTWYGKRKISLAILRYSYCEKTLVSIW